MTVTEWATVASLATAVGTLVLAVATFASVRSANFSARWEGGQRVITQFALRRTDDRWLTSTGRHFNVDRPDPR